MRELFEYDAETGALVRRVGAGGKLPGAHAGCAREHDGYVRVYVDRVGYQFHRMVWIWHHGCVSPDLDVDHVDGNRRNNRIENLRTVTRALNCQNQKRGHRDSATGLLGTTPNGVRFTAQITVNGKRRFLGNYDTVEEAHSVYLREKRKIHPGNTL